VRRADTQDRWLVHALRYLTPGSGAWRLAHKLREWRRTMPHIHPRQSWMAEQLGVSDRTIRRWIVDLEANAGCLVVTRHRPHHGPGGRWRRRTNSYRPCFRKRTGSIDRKVLVAPTGHPCPQDAPSGASEIAAGGSPPPPPAPPPWLALGITRIAWLEGLRE
jgi:hypothetical protein